MIDKQTIRAAFDQAASSYDAAAVLQREVVDRMLEKLSIMKLAPQHVLDVGCGTGYAGPLLLQRFPDARLIELDLAPSMLLQARLRHPTGSRHWIARLKGKKLPWQICGDAEALPLASASVDCIWSNLALQWCETPDQAFAECFRVLRPGGLFLFSTLGPNTLNELRTAFAGVDGQAHVNRFIDMHDLGDALGRAGFAAPVMEMENLVMTYDTVREVLADLKGIGAHSVRDGRRTGLMGKSAWREMEAGYEKFRNKGLLPATYEVLYGHAWKSDSDSRKSLPDGRQIIEFKVMPKQ
ncbi:MAG: malonyl-ACP O-methyltransferase BioC [Formivibrio sp.]|nr:malonyl-ACP O-methyltransferase BioC [Formivibrio sp.]